MRIVTVLLAGVVLLGSAPFDPASAQWRKRKEAPRSQTPIACTATGCAPIPAGCRLEVGFSSEGSLSGYDSVVCPAR